MIPASAKWVLVLELVGIQVLIAFAYHAWQAIMLAPNTVSPPWMHPVFRKEIRTLETGKIRLKAAPPVDMTSDFAQLAKRFTRIQDLFHVGRFPRSSALGFTHLDDRQVSKRLYSLRVVPVPQLTYFVAVIGPEYALDTLTEIAQNEASESLQREFHQTYPLRHCIALGTTIEEALVALDVQTGELIMDPHWENNLLLSLDVLLHRFKKYYQRDFLTGYRNIFPAMEPSGEGLALIQIGQDPKWGEETEAEVAIKELTRLEDARKAGRTIIIQVNSDKHKQERQKRLDERQVVRSTRLAAYLIRQSIQKGATLDAASTFNVEPPRRVKEIL